MNFKALWTQVLEKLQASVKRAQFITWFQDTAILRYDEGIMVIGVPNPFSHNWILANYADTIFDLVKEFENGVLKIEYEVHSSLCAEHAHKVDVKKLGKTLKKVRKLPNKNEVKLIEGISSKCLNPRYSLSNYVVGPENRLAHAAASAVCVRPGSTYNPLFIYGGVGLGKTHLLQAIGNEVLKNFQDKTVVYVTSEKFTNEIVEAIQKFDSKKFKEKYRNVDCLIIDDIQFLANKDRTQVEFFHTFNELYDMNKQIIISSDRAPKELAGLEDRLVNRFEMGMIVDVQAPDFETRLAILHRKARECEALIPADVIEFIAQYCSNSVRELEGVLKQVIAKSELENTMPSIKSVGEMIQKLSPKVKFVSSEEPTDLENHYAKVAVSIQDIVKAVAKFYKLSVDELIGTCRKREVMLPRQVCMYLIRSELKHSFEKIGEEFGGRNHTTVMHACEKMNDSLKVNQRLAQELFTIRKLLSV